MKDFNILKSWKENLDEQLNGLENRTLSKAFFFRCYKGREKYT